MKIINITEIFLSHDSYHKQQLEHVVYEPGSFIVVMFLHEGKYYVNKMNSILLDFIVHDEGKTNQYEFSDMYQLIENAHSFKKQEDALNLFDFYVETIHSFNDDTIIHREDDELLNGFKPKFRK